jgi:tetratricopeptide (TPR) repeat protein
VQGRSLALALAVLAIPAWTLPAIAAPGDEQLRRGISFYRSQRYAEALTEFQYAVHLAPRHDEAWAWLGVTYIALNRKDEALAAFRRSVELNPRGRQAGLAQQWIGKLQGTEPPPQPPEPVAATPAPRTPQAVWVYRLPPILSVNSRVRVGGIALYGLRYDTAILHTNRSGLISRTIVNLNGQYERFETTVGVRDNSNLLHRAVAKVLADDQVIFESATLAPAQPPAKVSVPVRGVTKLELQTTALPFVMTVVWADPKIFKE